MPRRPSPPARGAPRGARRHLAEGRLLAVGAVRLLHGAGRRQGRRQLPACRWRRSRASRSRRSRASPTRSATATPTAFARLRRPAVRLLHPRASSCAPRRRSTRRAPTSTRDDMARHLGAHLCRCTGYVKILDAIEAVAKGKHGRAARRPAASARAASSTRRVELRSATAATSTTSACPGMLHAALHLTDHARADIVRIDVDRGARPCPASSRVFTAADIPGELRVGIIHKDWPVFIPEGGRTSYRGDVLAIVVAETREQARAAAAARRRRLRRAARRSPIRSRPSTTRRRSRCGALDGNVLSRSAYARGDVDAALAGERPRRARGVPDPAHRARVPRAGVDARRAATGDGRALHVYSGGQGVWDDRDQIASVLGIDTRADHRRAGLQRRRLRRQGGHGATRRQTALAAWLLERPVKCTLSREESLLIHAKRHPIRMEYWAGCDADGRLTALRARMVGDSGPYAVGRA